MLGIRQPLPNPVGDAGLTHLRQDELGVEEVLPHELAERPTQLVLLVLHNRRVWDLQPQRMTEEGGDREPVGQPADHARLGGCPDEPHPLRRVRRSVHLPVAAQEVDDGGHEQQTGGDRLVLAQRLAAFGLNLWGGPWDG